LNIKESEEIIDKVLSEKKINNIDILIKEEIKGNEEKWRNKNTFYGFRPPQMRLTERGWGGNRKEGTLDEDRIIFTKYIKNIIKENYAGKGKSVSGKKLSSIFNYINDFLNKDEKSFINETPSQIISSLVFIETLMLLLNEFSASTTGRLFEAFISVVLGGHQLGDQTEIKDIETNEEYLSLKVVSSHTEIEGNFSNLLKDFAYDRSSRDMVYIVFEKQQLSKEEVGNLILKEKILSKTEIFNSIKTVLRETISEFLKEKMPQELNKFSTYTSVTAILLYLFETSSIPTQFIINKMLEKLGNNQSVVEIISGMYVKTSEQLKSKPFILKGFENIGELNIGGSLNLKTKLQLRTNVLNEQIKEIYNSLYDFQIYLNKYFVDEEQSGSSGMKAVESSQKMFLNMKQIYEKNRFFRE